MPSELKIAAGSTWPGSVPSAERHRKLLPVDVIRFSVSKGELFGLLGPNGAGVTTTIKMLTTLLIPTSGKAKVLGMDVVKQANQIRSRIGFIFDGERGIY